MCYLTRPYITFLVRKRSLQSIFLLTSQNTSLFNTMFILFSWVLLAWRKTAISVIFFFFFLSPCWLKASSGFLRGMCKNQFCPPCREAGFGTEGSYFQLHPCSPSSASLFCCLPFPPQQQELLSAWLASGLLWINWATGMWLFYPSLPQAIPFSAAASFTRAYSQFCFA